MHRTATELALRVLRILVALTILAAVVATFTETAARAAINPFNFFGYFTIQSNLFGAAVLLVVALRPARASSALVLARACATTYLIVVGIVYALLLAPLGAAGGVPVPWANTVMHLVTPIFFVLDWALAPDRHRLAWGRLWVVLVYPLVWCTVVLIRGATDGWVPYPFLDPATGYVSIAFFVLVIALTVASVGAIVWAASRLTRSPDLGRGRR